MNKFLHSMPFEHLRWSEKWVLPTETEYSTLQRFLMINEISYAQYRRLTGKSFSDSAVHSGNDLFSRPRRTTRRAIFRTPDSSTLRICPKCLRLSFISSLHQNLLYDTCFLCGTKLVNTELSYSRMYKAYELSKWNILDLFNIHINIYDVLKYIPRLSAEIETALQKDLFTGCKDMVLCQFDNNPIDYSGFRRLLRAKPVYEKTLDDIHTEFFRLSRQLIDIANYVDYDARSRMNKRISTIESLSDLKMLLQILLWDWRANNYDRLFTITSTLELYRTVLMDLFENASTFSHRKTSATIGLRMAVYDDQSRGQTLDEISGLVNTYVSSDKLPEGYELPVNAVVSLVICNHYIRLINDHSDFIRPTMTQLIEKNPPFIIVALSHNNVLSVRMMV